MGKLVEINNWSYTYGNCDAPAVKDINLSIEEGEFIVLCGMSGSGKSTLLKNIKEGSVPIAKGSVPISYSIDNMKDIGFVFQNPDNQIVTDKVWHEMAFGLENRGTNKNEIRLRVSEIASFFGIEEWFEKKTDELSGGQKQILNLASIMVLNPKLLLLDEPTAQLDPIASFNFMSILRKINQELGITIIMSEHNLTEAINLADRIVVMDNGYIVKDDTPTEVALFLANDKHPMYDAMPEAFKISRELAYGKVVFNVRQGRMMLNELYNGGIAHSNTDNKCSYNNEAEVVLEAKELWFRYDKNGKDILKGVNFTLNKGEIYCLFGGNGAGKSTFIKNLTGIRQPYSGNVKVDNKSIKKLSNKELFMDNIGVLPQNPRTLFIKEKVRDELDEMIKFVKQITRKRGE